MNMILQGIIAQKYLQPYFWWGCKLYINGGARVQKKEFLQGYKDTKEL